MATIHPTAIVENSASLANNVVIGPFCHVGPNVELASGVKLESHVVIAGHTQIGENTQIFPFASIGHQPQDLKYKGEKTRLVIGKNNKIREYVTMNPGTETGTMVTTVGDNCLFMIGAHVAHDCIVGDHVIMANNATLGGHVEVGDYAVIGGLSAVHQFVKVGKHSMIGGMSGIVNDIIPYGSAFGERAWLNGLNLVGLKRRGYGREEINSLRNAFKMLFDDSEENNFVDRVASVKDQFKASEPIMDIVNFIESDKSRAICRPRNPDLK